VKSDPPPKSSAAFKRFERLTKGLVSVPKKELEEKLKQDQAKKPHKPKPA